MQREVVNRLARIASLKSQHAYRDAERARHQPNAARQAFARMSSLSAIRARTEWIAACMALDALAPLAVAERVRDYDAWTIDGLVWVDDVLVDPENAS